MKHCNKRVSKIVDELLTYFLNLHATDISTRIQNLADQYKISITGDCKDLNDAEVQRLNRLLNTPQHEEMEEYYWELTGDCDVDSELALLGMMTTKAEINYQPGQAIEIILYRAK